MDCSIALNKDFEGIVLNSDFERADLSDLEDTLGPSAGTHCNRNTTTNYQLHLQRGMDGRVV